MWPVAVITFLEGIRSRVLYGIFLFSLFVMILSIVFSNFFMQDIGKVAVDLNLSAISFAGLLIALSLSVNLIAKDLDRKTIHFVLARPVSRQGYLLGKYLGLMLITLFAFALLTACSCLSLLFLKANNVGYFDTFRWSSYFQAIYFDLVKIGVFNSVIILFSTLTSSSFITMLFSVSIYIAGQSISEVVNFIELNTSGVEIAGSVEVAINVVKYVVPNFEVFDFKVISAHGHLVPASDFLSISAYGIIYSLIMLACSSLVFGRKEIL